MLTQPDRFIINYIVYTNIYILNIFSKMEFKILKFCSYRFVER